MPSSSPTPVLSGLRVLLVDPDADGRDLLAFFLEECGAVTRVESDAGEGLCALAAFSPDAIIANLGRGEDRYAFIRAVRAQGRSIFTVALTGHATVRDREQSLVEGFDRHVSKPFDLEAMVALLRGHVVTAAAPSGGGAVTPLGAGTRPAADRAGMVGTAELLASARRSSAVAASTVIELADFLARARAAKTALRARAKEPTAAVGPSVLDDALEELDAHEEELRMADEEMHRSALESSDLAARSRVELKLYQDHFDRSPDGFAVTDARGTVQQANATLTALLGAPARAIAGRPLLHFVARTDCPAFRLALGELQTKGSIHGVILRLRPRSGGPVFHAELNARLDRAQGVARWAVRDVEARMAGALDLERRLREAEAALASATANAI